MESRNPVFGRSEQFARGGHATFDSRTPTAGDLQGMYDAPTATSRETGRMTIDDVVMRTATLFGVLLIAAAATFTLIQPGQFGIVLGAALIGLVLSLVISFSKTIRPPLMIAYAAIEGVFVGGISLAFNTAYPGIVVQAVLGTLAAFGAMLALYRTGVIKATPKFQKIVLIAGAGYLAFGLINLVVALVSGHSAYQSPLGWLIGAFGVSLASLFLVLDFDYIDQGIRNGLPRQYAWTAAFGLLVTLVWLYVEILRLLAILRGDN
jgi:uncharacterized YccA/Bax inhibitor family protein